MASGFTHKIILRAVKQPKITHKAIVTGSTAAAKQVEMSLEGLLGKTAKHGLVSTVWMALCLLQSRMATCIRMEWLVPTHTLYSQGRRLWFGICTLFPLQQVCLLHSYKCCGAIYIHVALCVRAYVHVRACACMRVCIAYTYTHTHTYIVDVSLSSSVSHVTQ